MRSGEDRIKSRIAELLAERGPARHLRDTITVMRFTNLDRWAMWRLAVKRQGLKNDPESRATNDNDLRVWPQQRKWEQYHYVGIKGESAVARFLGADLDLGGYQGGDRAVGDLTVNGWSVEVKTQQRWLLLKRRNEFRADVAVLVNPWGEVVDERLEVGDPHNRRDVVIVGWCSQEDVDQSSVEMDFGHGLRLVMRDEALRPLGDIHSLLRRTRGEAHAAF